LTKFRIVVFRKSWKPMVLEGKYWLGLLNGYTVWKQRVCLNGVYYQWQMVRSGVPQGSVLGPVLFYFHKWSGLCNIANTILKFADDTKLISTVNNHDGSTVLQRDLSTLENWTRSWQMKFDVELNYIQMEWNAYMANKYPIYMYMNYSVLGTTNEQKDLGVIITDDLLVSKHCVSTYFKANKILGMIKRTIISIAEFIQDACSSTSGVLFISLVTTLPRGQKNFWRRYSIDL